MVLVTLVVVGHAIGLVEETQGSHWVYDFLYLWHIPAFVFVSGYLSKSFEWDRRRMKNLVYTLLVPYLIFEPALFYYRRHRGRRERDRTAVARAALDDVVPHRAADVAPGHPDPQAALALPAAVRDRQPGRVASGTPTR